jgi:hypothetical protein
MHDFLVHLLFFHLDACMHIYVQIFPVIEFISAHSGSLAGGQLLTIQGRGFGGLVELITVEIEGMPCTVVSVAHDVVTCMTSAWDTSVDSKGLYQGGAGIQMKDYTPGLSARFPIVCFGFSLLICIS